LARTEKAMDMNTPQNSGRPEYELAVLNNLEADLSRNERAATFIGVGYMLGPIALCVFVFNYPWWSNGFILVSWIAGGVHYQRLHNANIERKRVIRNLRGL